MENKRITSLANPEIFLNKSTNPASSFSFELQKFEISFIKVNIVPSTGSSTP